MMRSCIGRRYASRSAHILTLAAWLACAAGVALAQPDGPPEDVQPAQAKIAASEESLWLGLTTESQSRLYYRPAGGTFDLGRETNGRILLMAALDRDALVFFDGSAPYRYLPDEQFPKVAADLPGNSIPHEILSAKLGKFAIVNVDRDADAPANAGERPLGLLTLRSDRWEELCALPPEVSAGKGSRLGPRLCAAHDQLLLLAPSRTGQHIVQYLLGPENTWEPRGSINVSSMAAMWVFTANEMPLLITATPTAAGGERLTAMRLAKNAAEASALDWRPVDVQVSALPDGVHITRYEAAAAFSQHVVLLCTDDTGASLLQFGRTGEAPAESTVQISEVVTTSETRKGVDVAIQITTFAVLVAILAMLFVFRRGSMVTSAVLPPGYALALNLQRLVAWAIDFLPFTLIAAKSIGVSWSSGFATLAGWGISPDPDAGLPDVRILSWWAMSAVCYTVYMLIMELLTRRSIGKVIAGVRLLSEVGHRPSAGQIFVRNAIRLVELMPQFWIFALFVVLSRNRQRVGDILARTVVVRQVALPTMTIRVDQRAVDAMHEAEQLEANAEADEPQDEQDQQASSNETDEPQETPSNDDENPK